VVLQGNQDQRASGGRRISLQAQHARRHNEIKGSILGRQTGGSDENQDWTRPACLGPTKGICPACLVKLGKKKGSGMSKVRLPARPGKKDALRHRISSPATECWQSARGNGRGRIHLKEMKGGKNIIETIGTPESSDLARSI